MNAEDPLFILYVGLDRYKGVLHTTGGYLTFVDDASHVFDYHEATSLRTAAWAGSPATATSSMDRSPTARPRSCLGR